jgi:hypothetical protein
MQDFDDPDSDRCRYCGMSLRFCDCGSTCMNGHSHETETDHVADRGIGYPRRCTVCTCNEFDWDIYDAEDGA